MDIEQYKNISFSTVTESVLPRRLRFAEDAVAYDAHTLELKNPDAFEKCVQGVVGGQYNLDDEGVRKLFVFDSIDKSFSYLDLIFYEAGKRLSQEAESVKLKQLSEYYENMESGFFPGYTIPEERTKLLISKFSSDQVLEKIRSCAGSRKEVYNLCVETYKKGAKDNEIIDQISPYTDGSCIELPGYVRLLSLVMLDNKRYAQWVILLRKLKYFPLQDAIIMDIKTIEDFQEIIEAFRKAKNISYRKVLLHLLREHMFYIISNQPQLLERNKNNSSIKKIYQKECEKQLAEWNKDVVGFVQENVLYFASELKYSDCSEWYSRKVAQYSGRDSKFIKYELKALDLINAALKNISKPSKWKIKGADINTLFYYVQQSDSLDLTPERCGLIINEIHSRVYGDSYHLNFKLDDDGVELLRQLYKCYLKSGLDGVELLKRNRGAIEGYQKDYGQATHTAYGDALFLSFLLLGTGEDKQEQAFSEYIKLLELYLSQSISPERDYLLPLYIAELVVSQELPQLKDGFESDIINNVPSLYLVLRALAGNDGKMSEEVMTLLKDRLEKEWAAEKRLLGQRKVEMRGVELYVDKVLKYE